jgi:hypothetical protein
MLSFSLRDAAGIEEIGGGMATPEPSSVWALGDYHRFARETV